MNRINQFTDELDGKGKVFSALLSVLTLFAILGMIAPGWYGQMPRYSEGICGVTGRYAYCTNGDDGNPGFVFSVCIFICELETRGDGEDKGCGTGLFMHLFHCIVSVLQR